MDKYKYVFRDSNTKTTEKILDSFIGDKDKSITTSLDEYLKLNPILRTKVSPDVPKRKVGKRRKGTLDAKDYKKIKLTPNQETRVKDIRKKFENLGRTLTKEESDYVAEAIGCLEANCPRASVVMIWASGISRVIKFTSKDLKKFNSASQQMNTSKKPPYTYVKNYKTNATQEDDLRDGHDRQLLNYLLYQKMLSKPEYNQLSHCYGTRCDCAHPTNINLKINKVLSIFEDIYDLIFNNSQLK